MYLLFTTDNSRSSVGFQIRYDSEFYRFQFEMYLQDYLWKAEDIVLSIHTLFHGYNCVVQYHFTACAADVNINSACVWVLWSYWSSVGAVKLDLHLFLIACHH